MENIDFMKIRMVEIKDIDRINDIYNQAICEKFKVADLTPWTKDKRLEWLKEHNTNEYPIYIAEIDNIVVGFIYISPYRPGRMALRQTVEISYFIDKDYRRRGIGKKLVEHMESECIKLGIKTLFAIVIDNNEESKKLLEKFGYEKWGHLPKIALFDNIEVGHLYYGKRIIL
jgi:phosphinothricin acetyltransferase